MKENFTSINVVLDMSGSMHSLTSDTIGGFNKFLEDQKAEPGEAVVTLCTFNTDYRLVHECLPLKEVPLLDNKTYHPVGGTALLDALGKTMNSVGQHLAAMPESERPSKVLFLVITDGQENSSREFKRQQIKDMIKHQTEKYSWLYVYLGANVDSFAEASALGVDTRNSLNYSATSKGTRSLYDNISENTSRLRSKSVAPTNFFDSSIDSTTKDSK